MTSLRSKISLEHSAVYSNETCHMAEVDTVRQTVCFLTDFMTSQHKILVFWIWSVTIHMILHRIWWFSTLNPNNTCQLEIGHCMGSEAASERTGSPVTRVYKRQCFIYTWAKWTYHYKHLWACNVFRTVCSPRVQTGVISGSFLCYLFLLVTCVSRGMITSSLLPPVRRYAFPNRNNWLCDFSLAI